MPDFQYTARELSGTEVTGVLTAANEHEAVNTLAGRALFPTSVVAAETEAAHKRKAGKKVRSRFLSVFYSQLADLLHSGVPLLRSLEILQQQSSQPTLAMVLKEVHADVSEGTRLADAMNRHPRVF